MKEIYHDGTYLAKNPDWHEKDASFKAGYISRLFRLIPDQILNVADIGCGTGQIMAELCNLLPEQVRFFGFDISTDAIRLARNKESERIKVDLLDLVSRSEKDCIFDVILVIDVLEHVENYFAFLDGIVKKARYTIFHIPLDLSLWSLFREKMLLESKERVGHIHNFTEDFIKSILEDQGFKILYQLYTPPTGKPKSTKEVIINGLRKLLFKMNKRFASKTIGGYSILLLTENKQGPTLSL
jgi:SAM-dependent methyltransferase